MILSKEISTNESFYLYLVHISKLWPKVNICTSKNAGKGFCNII